MKSAISVIIFLFNLTKVSNQIPIIYDDIYDDELLQEGTMMMVNLRNPNLAFDDDYYNEDY